MNLVGKKILKHLAFLKKPLALIFFVLFLGSITVYIWISIVTPRLVRMPSNFTYDADVVSYDDFFDSQTQKFSGPVRSETKLSYRVIRTEGEVNIVENTFDVHKPTGEQIIAIKREYGIDAQTQKHVPGYGDKSRVGYFFGPPNANLKEFTYWQVNYDVPIDMKFVSNEKIAGVNTMHYKAVFTADQTTSLTNLQDVGKTLGISTDVDLQLWIEPTSGHLVKYEDQAIAYFYNLATKERLNPWNKFSNTFSFNSTAMHAHLAEQERQYILLVSIAIPVFIAVLILIIMLAIAIYSYRRQGIARLNAAIVICLAVVSLIFWYTVGLSVPLPEWLEPIYPGASVGILMLALYFFIMRLKPVYIRGYLIILFIAALFSTILALNGIVTLAHFDFIIPVVGGREPLLLSSSAAVIVAYSVIILLKQIFKNRIVSYVCEAISAAIVIIILFSVIGYAYSDSINLIRLPAACALFLIGISIFASEPNWFISKQIRNLGKGVWVFSFIAIGMLIITGLAWRATILITRERVELQFQSDVNIVKEQIKDRLRIYINVLYGAQSLFAASDDVGRSEWKSYVDGLKIAENLPGVQGIGFAQIVPSSEINAHTESVRAQGFPTYAIHPLEPLRDVYSSIVYIEPFDERNQRAFGFDMFSESTRRIALEQARDTGEAAMTGRVILVQETKEDVQYGFLVYVPVFEKNAPLATVEDRRAALLGYVYSPFRMNNFMQSILDNQSIGINLEIFDVSSQDKAEDLKMYSSKPSNTEDSLVDTQLISIAGHTWKVQFTGTLDYGNNLDQVLPNVVLLGGIILSFALAATIFELSSSRQRAMAYAARLTRDLADERDSALEVQNKDEAILSGMIEGLLVLDRNGNIQKVNKAALLLLGYKDPKELIGKDFMTSVHAFTEDGRSIPLKRRPAFKVLRTGVAAPKVKIQYEHKDGSKFWALISIAPITHRGRIAGVLELFRDITAERQLDKAKDEFLSVVSHQLRTPITAERWYLDILQDKPTAGKLTKRQQEDIVQKVSESNNRMSELITALLNVSRAESGRLAIQPVPTNVSKLIKDSIDELNMRFSKKQQQVIQDIPKTPIISVDPTLVRQIVVNLLTNASKYSPEKTRIFVSLAKQDPYLVCTVRDEGYGVPADQQSRLFTKFFRADNAVKLEANGNGLGLYLVKTIVEMSGGEISFESKEGVGTTFKFTLPLAGSRSREGIVKLEEHKGQNND